MVSPFYPHLPESILIFSRDQKVSKIPFLDWRNFPLKLGCERKCTPYSFMKSDEFPLCETEEDTICAIDVGTKLFENISITRTCRESCLSLQYPARLGVITTSVMFLYEFWIFPCQKLAIKEALSPLCF